MLNNSQREVVGLFIKHNLYLGKANKETIEKYATELAHVRDTSQFVKEFAKKIGDKHSFIVSDTAEDKTDDTGFDFETSLSNGVAHFAVPPVFGSEDTYKKYAKELFGAIKELSTQSPVSWEIDLTKNWGGNMWPMLASLHSFFTKKGAVGMFKYSDGRIENWDYKNNGIFSGTKKMFDISEATEGLTDTPVTIFIGNKTGSSGEAVAIAFKSRQNTYFSGEKTAGLTTGNEEFKLNDGSVLWLCTCEMADAKSRIYPNGVSPDSGHRIVH